MKERRGSYGNVEDMLKRKRMEKGEEETFSRSKKTPKSPATTWEEGKNEKEEMKNE